jgi:hypothetical protein
MNFVLAEFCQFKGQITLEYSLTLFVSRLNQSLILRLTRARQLQTLLSSQPSYTHQFSKESLVELSQTITQIEGFTQQGDQLMKCYQASVLTRQLLYQKAPLSLKTMSDAVLAEVGQQHGLTSTPYQVCKLVVHKIRVQNALPAPNDLYSPAIEKEWQRYERSYQALTGHFRLLIKTLTLFDYYPADPSLRSDFLQARLMLLEQSGQETRQSRDALLCVYQERAVLFRHLKRQIDAILKRVRHVYGATDAVYLAARKMKI